ncbi:MAG TPA: ATP-binding protein, partial [Deltaproteobacteria bacterium]|nr:ATP-binding protein [Deltaproteobacteria bacterium]
MKFQSLRFKINAAITLACLIVALFFGAVFSFFEAHRREVRIQEIRLLLSTVFEQKRDEIANEIFARQEEALKISMQNLLQVKGITEIAVHDTDGNPLFSTDHALDRILTSKERSALTSEASFGRTEILGRSHAEYATAIEVIGERVGFIRMFYDLEELDMESLRAFWMFVALLVSTLFVMSFLLNKLLHRFVLRPTTMLGEAIARLQNGELGGQIPQLSADEIGRVAMAFNDLSAMLEEQHRALLASMETRQKYARELEQANKVLEQLNARLEDMVQERTAELLKSNEQLRTEMNERIKADRARVELEERLARSQKMEALGLLAGGVAHDLNNVLSGTVSYPDLLLMELPEDSPLRKPLRTIRDSGQKAAAIVQDLLTLARRGVMSMETLDLNEQIIHDYLGSPEHLHLVTQHPDTRIELRLDENLLKIKGSPVHLRKTLMNLVINAMEAQPQGGRITITTQNTFVERPIEGYDAVSIGDYVVLRVEDDGVGIEQQDLKRIFEPFFTTKVMGRSGTGLGMA